MKRQIGIALMSLVLIGCSSTIRKSEPLPVTQSETDVLMEHRYVQLALDTTATQTTSRPATRERRYPAQQRWTSATIEAEFPFTELLPSWNVSVPADAGVRWDVRVRDAATRKWSPWLYIGYWGRVTRDKRTTEFEGGQVDIDTLRLTSPADAFELRSTGMSFRVGNPELPVVRRAQAVYSRPLGANSVAAPATQPVAVDLPVPFRPQGIEDPCISGSICSPTSVSMVMEWAGLSRPTQENALAIWDDDYSIFGNWNRAVQHAASHGFEAQLERFTTMDQARERLAQGQPLIVSINFEANTFPSNVMNETDGHLIVIRGFTSSGDLIVNDPASKDRGNGIIYKADELARAWLINTGGVAYVIRKRE